MPALKHKATRATAAERGCHEGWQRTMGWGGEGRYSQKTYMANGIASGDQRNAGMRNQPQMPDMNDTI